jgi:CheY-like chemotaxis protein
LYNRHLALYVDCDPATLSQGVLLLRALGHIVVASTDAELAISIAAKEPVTIVVMCESVEADHRAQMVRMLRSIRGDIPVLLFSQSGQAREYLGTELNQGEPESLDVVLRRAIQ